MVLDGLVSSPLKRPQILKKQWEELGSALLTFLCTTYLYFAVTLSSSHSCYGLTGKEKAMCQLEQDQAITKGNVTDQS